MYSVNIFNKLVNYSFNSNSLNVSPYTLSNLISNKYNKTLTKVFKV